MNNLLNFEEYKNHIHSIEEQIIINEFRKNKINEGLITKWKKFRSTKLVDKILRDEIELGKDFEERVKATMDELSKACDEIKDKTKKGSEFTQKINEIIDQINKISFDTLSLIGDQSIDFSGFRNSVIMANVVKLGALLSPIKNGLMIKKAYDYFLGLIKQAVRRDLVMLIVNFDQFQSIILQKSMEATSKVKNEFEGGRYVEQIVGIYKDLIQNNLSKGDAETIMKLAKEQRQQLDQEKKYDTAFNGYMDAYNNTYKTTADSIKQLMGDDNQRQLDALKNGISKLGQGNDDLSVYGEMLISIAEEKALKSTHTIHTNFLKMSEVFKLANQKKLIDLIVEAEKAETKKIKSELEDIRDEFKLESKEEQYKFVEEEFNKIKKDIDLSSITLKQLNELKEDYIKLKYSKESAEKLGIGEEKFSKYYIITTYLNVNTDELKHCSNDLRMMVVVDPDDEENYGYTYYAYVDTLSDSILKILNKENSSDDNCYMDISLLRSPQSVDDIFNRFKKDNDKDTHILRYINDNIEKFTYKTFLEKIHVLLDLETEDVDKIKEYFTKLEKIEDTPEYEQYIEKKRLYDGWIKADKLSKKAKESTSRNAFIDEKNRYLSDYKKYMKSIGEDVDDKSEEIEKPKLTSLPNTNGIKLKIKINEKDYTDWKKSFEYLKEYKNNGYVKPKK